MATIVRRKQKKGWMYRVLVRRKGYPSVSRTFRRLTDARKWAQRVEDSIERGVFVTDDAARSTLLSTLVARYTNRAPLEDALGDAVLDADGRPKLGGNPEFLGHPKRDCRKTVRKLEWWTEHLGDPTLDRLLDGRLLREALGALRSGASPSGEPVKPATANRYLAALRGCLSYGVEHRLLPRNPAKGIRQGREEQRARWLDDRERKDLFRACEQSTDRRLYPLVLLALATGGRQGELLALKWSDIDLRRNRVVFRAETRKNSTARGIGVSSEVLSVLRDRLVRTVGVDLVFADSNGRVRFPRGGWEKALIEAEIEDFRFHDCRHDFASRLAESGATLAELAEALGHKTLAMVKRYSHLTEGHVADVTRRASEALL